jgi:hypothetical protein
MSVTFGAHGRSIGRLLSATLLASAPLLSAGSASAYTYYYTVKSCAHAIQTSTTEGGSPRRLNLSVNAVVQAYGSSRAQGTAVGPNIEARLFLDHVVLGVRPALLLHSHSGQYGSERVGWLPAVEALVGWHSTYREREEVSSDVGEGVYCDYQYRKELYSSHVLGLSPYFARLAARSSRGQSSSLFALFEDEAIITTYGGHFMYQWDRYRDGRSGRYLSSGKESIPTDTGFILGVGVGYLTGFGLGGTGILRGEMGAFQTDLAVGGYQHGGWFLFSLGLATL